MDQDIYKPLLPQSNLRQFVFTVLLLSSAMHNVRGGTQSPRNLPLIGTKAVQNAQVSLLDNTTKDTWLNFDNWQCSAPSPLPDPLLASYYSADTCGERILVLSLTSTTYEVETWTYRLKTNSWSLIENRQRNPLPEFQSNSALLTICRTKVLYLVGRGQSNSSLWMFDSQSESWSAKSVRGRAPPETTNRNSHDQLYFVFLDQTATHSNSCECSHVVVGFRKKFRDVWKLSCNDTQIYAWNYVKAGKSEGNEVFRITKSFYPRKVVYSSAIAETTEGFVLLTASNGLWKYDIYSNQWLYVSNSSDFRYNTVATTFYSENTKMYILMSPLFDGFKLQLYNLHTKVWTTAKVSSTGQEMPQFESSHIALYASDSSRFLLYKGVLEGCIQHLWELRNETDGWKWTRIEGPRKSPIALEGETAVAESVNWVDSSLYVLLTRDVCLELWELRLDTMTWICLEKLESHLVEASSIRTAVVHRNIYLLIYSSKWRWESNMSVRAYHIKNYSWVLNSKSRDYIYGRNWRIPVAKTTDYCVAPVDNSSFILYGCLCDLWIANMTSQDTSPLYWYRLESNCTKGKGSKRPPPRAHYKAAVIDTTVVIMGGMEERKGTITVSCFRDVWHFSLLNYTWIHAFVDDWASRDQQMCIVSAVAVGKQVAVTFRSSDYIPNTRLKRYELWFYVVPTRKWIWYTEMAASLEETFRIFVWRGLIFFLETGLGSMWYKKLVCPPGYISSDVSERPCVACPVGCYATGKGETSGIPCPQGLTTISGGSTSLANCSQCKNDHCVYGVCRVFLNKEGSTCSVCFCIRFCSTRSNARGVTT